jgi:hypothetical protein
MSFSSESSRPTSEPDSLESAPTSGERLSASPLPSRAGAALHIDHMLRDRRAHNRGVLREKGIILANARAFVETRFGVEPWQVIVAGLSPEDAAALRGMVATSWYDVGFVLRVFRRMVDVLAGGDEALLVTFARFQAERDLKVTYRLFFRLANPAFVLEKAMSYWSRFHDRGRWIIERPTETSALGNLVDFPIDDPLFCRHLTAYLIRMFELVGAHRVDAQHTRCRTTGGETCSYLVTWR